MGKLYLGSTKVTPFVKQDVIRAPSYIPSKAVVNGVLVTDPNQTAYSTTPATNIGNGVLREAFNGSSTITSADLSSLTQLSNDNACLKAFYNCQNLTSMNLSNLISITGNSACSYMLYNCKNLSSLDMSNLTTLSGYQAMQYCFQRCTNLTTVDLSSLTTVSGNNAMDYCFDGCTGLTSVNLSNLNAATGNSGMRYCFNNCTNLANVDLSSLTTVSNSYSMMYCFYNCNRLTSVNLSNLQTVSGYQAMYQCFYGCTSLTSVDLSSLTTVSDATNGHVMSYCFYGCTSLTSVDLSSLTTLSGNYAMDHCFYGCTSLTSIYFPSMVICPDITSRNRPCCEIFANSSIKIVDLRNLTYCGNYGLLDGFMSEAYQLTTVNLNSLEHLGNQGARAMLWLSNGASSSLTDIYFPMLTSFGGDPFYNNAFTGRLNITIHFRKDMQAVVEALPNYATLWGAGSGSSVVFDLAGTLIGNDSNSYIRSEKDSVYQSETAGATKTATAWKYNNVLYYTSGASEPAIGNTIYSDSTCTTAVTTIDSIA